MGAFLSGPSPAWQGEQDVMLMDGRAHAETEQGTGRYSGVLGVI